MRAFAHVRVRVLEWMRVVRGNLCVVGGSVRVDWWHGESHTQRLPSAQGTGVGWGTLWPNQA